MSDQGVRKLSADLLNLSDLVSMRGFEVTLSQMESRITAFLAEREDLLRVEIATLRGQRDEAEKERSRLRELWECSPEREELEGQLDRALGELARARKALEAEADICGACSGTGRPTKMSAMGDSVAPDGSCSVCYEIRAALAGSPLGERVEEVLRTTMLLTGIIERIGKRKGIRGIGGDANFITAAAGLCVAVDALRAEPAKRGE